MRTPLKTVQHLGSARDGTDHFWRLRVTSVALIFLATFLVGLVISLIGADYAVVRRTLANPIVAVLLLLLVLSGVSHMRLGMQEIIVDYAHGEGWKITLLLLNTFFSFVVALICVLAVVKLSFGG